TKKRTHRAGAYTFYLILAAPATILVPSNTTAVRTNGSTGTQPLKSSFHRSTPIAVVLTVAVTALLPTARVRTADDLGVPSKDGLVVCVSSPACDAGASVLAEGGNAVDAAVATAFALAVTHPSAGNIGGGGFMIVRTASGAATAFDYREKAPLASTKTMYLDAQGKIARQLTDTGYKAPGVPGTVRGLQLAHDRFAKLPSTQTVIPPA